MLQQIMSLVCDLYDLMMHLQTRITVSESNLHRIDVLERENIELRQSLSELSDRVRPFILTIGSDEVQPWFERVERELALNTATIQSRLGVTDEERYAAYDH